MLEAMLPLRPTFYVRVLRTCPTYASYVCVLRTRPTYASYVRVLRTRPTYASYVCVLRTRPTYYLFKVVKLYLFRFPDTLIYVPTLRHISDF